MNKIYRNNKICALFISTALAFPLMGGTSYDERVHNYNHTSVIDNNTGAHLNLTEDMVREVMECDDECITFSFDDNSLTFDVSSLKNNLVTEKKKKIFSNISGSIIYFSFLGGILYSSVLSDRNKNKEKNFGSLHF